MLINEIIGEAIFNFKTNFYYFFTTYSDNEKYYGIISTANEERDIAKEERDIAKEERYTAKEEKDTAKEERYTAKEERDTTK